VACPPSDTRRRCRTGAPAGALALHPVRRLAQHTGLEREPVGPAPIVRRSMPVSSSRASAVTCALVCPPSRLTAAGRQPGYHPRRRHRGPQRRRLPAHPRRPARPHHPRRNPPPPRPRLAQKRTFTEHAGALVHRPGPVVPGDHLDRLIARRSRRGRPVARPRRRDRPARLASRGGIRCWHCSDPRSWPRWPCAVPKPVSRAELAFRAR